MRSIICGILTLPDNTVFNVSIEAFTTSATDTPANTVFHGDIVGKLGFSKKAGFKVMGTSSKTSLSNVTLANEPAAQGPNKGRGRYDELFSKEIRFSKFQLFIKKPFAPFSSAIQIGFFLLDSIVDNTYKTVTLAFGDITAKMENTTNHEYFPSNLPFTPNRGVAEAIGIGTVKQAPLHQTDKALHRYQVHSGPSIVSTQALEDRKDPYATSFYTNITIPETGGSGYDLNGKPDGTLTADFVGANYPLGKGNFGNTKLFKYFIRYLLTEHAGYELSEIDLTTLDATSDYWNFRYGYWVEQPTSVKSIVQCAMDGHIGCYFQSNQGQIVFNYLSNPTGSPVKEITKSNIKEIKPSLDRASGLSDSVASQKNFYVFTMEDIENITGLSEETKAEATRPYRSIYTSSTTTSGGSPYADEYEHAVGAKYIETCLTNSANGVSLANALQTIYSSRKDLYRIDYKDSDPFEVLTLELLDVINITYDRYGLESGKLARLLEISTTDLTKGNITIVGWG